MTDAIAEQVRQALRAALPSSLPCVPRGETPLLVAWSGGLDSTVLLHVLARLRSEISPKLRLHALHVDHGLRPGSAADADFCRELGGAWGVDTRVVRLAIAPGNSPQLQARFQRYAALDGAAAELGARHVATAHHADDALETALLHGARGSSAPAVASLLLPTTLPGSGVSLIRPLLSARRDQLLEYARGQQLRWREDPTNAATTYARNRLRHEALPELFPTALEHEAALARLRALADVADETRSAAEALRAVSSRRPPWIDALRFDRNALRAADPEIVREAIRQALRDLHGAHLPHVTAEDLLSAIYDRRSGLRSFTGHGLVARVEGDRVDLLPSAGQGTRLLDARRAEAMRLAADQLCGDLPWFEHRLTWRPARPGETADGIERLILPATTAGVVQGPSDGARLTVAAATHSHGTTRRVRDLLAAHRVPPSERWRWPCVYATGESGESGERGELLWVCGIRACGAWASRVAEQGDRAIEHSVNPSTPPPRL